MKRNLFLINFLAVFAFFFASNSCDAQQKKVINLLDKANIAKWRGYENKTLPPGWGISNGVLWVNNEQADDATLKGNKDIIYSGMDPNFKGSRDVIFGGTEFEYFELTIDWKISKGGNSGIYYHLKEGYKSPSNIAPEYQLIDDVNYAKMHPDLKDYNSQFGAAHPEQLQDWQKTGADYAMYTADESKKILHPVGEWNTTKIIVAPGRNEYWLNGVKLLDFEPWSADWYARKKAGKWAKSENYGKFKTGYIGLQYHGSSMWFKNITVKQLK